MTVERDAPNKRYWWERAGLPVKRYIVSFFDIFLVKSPSENAVSFSRYLYFRVALGAVD